jgi:hypothetical protein
MRFEPKRNVAFGSTNTTKLCRTFAFYRESKQYGKISCSLTASMLSKSKSNNLPMRLVHNLGVPSTLAFNLQLTWTDLLTVQSNSNSPKDTNELGSVILTHGFR